MLNWMHCPPTPFDRNPTFPKEISKISTRTHPRSCTRTGLYPPTLVRSFSLRPWGLDLGEALGLRLQCPWAGAFQEPLEVNPTAPLLPLLLWGHLSIVSILCPLPPGPPAQKPPRASLALSARIRQMSFPCLFPPDTPQASPREAPGRPQTPGWSAGAGSPPGVCTPLRNLTLPLRFRPCQPPPDPGPASLCSRPDSTLLADRQIQQQQQKGDGGGRREQARHLHNNNNND